MKRLQVGLKHAGFVDCNDYLYLWGDNTHQQCLQQGSYLEEPTQIKIVKVFQVKGNSTSIIEVFNRGQEQPSKFLVQDISQPNKVAMAKVLSPINYMLLEQFN